MRFMPAVLALPFLLAVSAQAQDLPARKPGLWEIKVAVGGRALPIKDLRHCVDQSTDKMMNAALGLASLQACSRKDVVKSGNTTTIDSVCKVGKGANTAHTVISGNFDSAYTVQIDSKTEDAPLKGAAAALSGETHMTIDARYLGACERGQKPGDVIMGGIRMNIQNMPDLATLGALGGLLQ